MIKNIEIGIQMQKYVHLRFTDYAKAFDKVRYKDLFEPLGKLNLLGKDARIIQNLYWDQTA